MLPHWAYDAKADRVTADVYIPCPEHNPCKDKTGAEAVLGCIGHPSNLEILVDTASLKDGKNVRLSLSEATTDLKLLLADGSKIHLHTDH